MRRVGSPFQQRRSRGVRICALQLPDRAHRKDRRDLRHPVGVWRMERRPIPLRPGECTGTGIPQRPVHGPKVDVLLSRKTRGRVSCLSALQDRRVCLPSVLKLARPTRRDSRRLRQQPRWKDPLDGEVRRTTFDVFDLSARGIGLRQRKLAWQVRVQRTTVRDALSASSVSSSPTALLSAHSRVLRSHIACTGRAE